MSISSQVAALEAENARKDAAIASLRAEIASKAHLIDTLSAQLDDRGDRPLEIDFMHRLGLTKSEAALLGHFVVANGRPLDRVFIESVLPCRDHARERGLKIVDVTLSKLRKKLPGVVQTVKGYGWRVDPHWRG
jgi:DNA-binding response OmpR family regulator